jgi:hypothetical protein
MSKSDTELAEWSKRWKAEREAQEIAKQNAWCILSCLYNSCYIHGLEKY